MLKKVLPAAIAASLLAGATAPAQADFSANQRQCMPLK